MIQPSNRTLSHSYLNLRIAGQTKVLHIKFPRKARVLKQRKTQHTMKIFMATKKGRSLMSQDAMQVTGR